jgi:hypothetical protein
MMSTMVPELLVTEQAGSISFWDPASGCRIEAHSPRKRPDLWRSYVDGLTESYHRYGVEAALDLDSFASGDSTSLFFVAFSQTEEIVAGVRMHGPLASSEDAHALIEFAADPTGVATVERLIGDRLPFGVLEIKGGWVAHTANDRDELSNTIARCFLHAMTILDVQFAFCTAGTHAVKRWLSTGSVVAEGLVPVPYPDERYQTTMMWWDFTKLHERADPAQLRRFRGEAAVLARSSVVNAVRSLPRPRAHA